MKRANRTKKDLTSGPCARCPDKHISEFTDAELAAMVRNSVYAKGTVFGGGPHNSRFLLVLAVPYGETDGVDDLPTALEAFRDLLTGDDWDEREFQVYDNKFERFFDIRYEDTTCQHD